ncbi:6-pyruvoyl tetrahydropterin synthase [Planctomycetes bacterium Pla163]|uniref:6-carboxy-5,6,7,8-tetrahydropterin synthase n=1 Tax=Rohdeia mirabilis TaxID=2528008 RepID=A0A518D175_9BACT|nr:6-pyruvoyl tetrahydropterin synthase [Planctomycetes bacterium Pla163]
MSTAARPTDPRETWSIEIDKEYLKFSCAHFLIFADGTAERLHGHNYRVYAEVDAALDDHGLVIDFIEVKPVIRELCDWLDEHWLLPGQHPDLSVRDLPARDGLSEHVEVRFKDRLYTAPKDNVIVLPINNTSAENFAGYIGRELATRLRQRFPAVQIRLIEIKVEETPGQRGVFRMRG